MCRVPEGRDVGKPLTLRQWQRAEIKRIYDNPHGTRRAILSFGRKNGKALCLDTPIPTPKGWRTIRDIEPDDEVYGADGLPHRVLATSQIFIGKRCYRLTFSDGTKIVASEDHLWQTRHSYRPWAKARVNGSGYGGRWRNDVISTANIAESVYRVRKDGGKEHNHKIGVAPAIQSGDVPLPIDPYVLGVWLGDGYSRSARIACGDQDLDNLTRQLSAAGYPSKVRKEKTAWKVSVTQDRNGILQVPLRRLGLLGNKHIPEAYLNAGTAQRWALLQGLMDTDGGVNRCGGQTTARCSFSNTRHSLAFGAWRLARSLGLKATITESDARLNGRVTGRKWLVEFAASADERIFRLERKQSLLPKAIGARSRTLAIVKCEEIESVPTKCLAVDSPDNLFLAGYGCVPTHNTALAALLLLLHLCGPEARANSQLYSAAQSRDQAAILFSLASKIVRMSPELTGYVVIRDTAKQLYCPELGTLYRALSADATTAYGLSPVFIVHDELGQVRGPRSELYEALETATAAQDSPLSLVISTQAPTDADLLSVLIDDALAGHDPAVIVSLFSAPDSLDPFSEDAIRAANPAFGDFQNAKEVLAMAEGARRMPSREAEYRNLILNQRVAAEELWIPPSVWDLNASASEFDRLIDAPVYVGADLSATQDLTAVVAACPDDEGIWHTRCWFFLPRDGILDRARADRVPYDVWNGQGLLIATPGRTVDEDFVAATIKRDLAGRNIVSFSYDRWQIDRLKKAFARADYGPPMMEFGQGFKSMSPAVKAVETLALQSRLRHGKHPILTMCIANSRVEIDASGNRKLTKKKATGRIDGAIALAMAIGSADTAEDSTSVYDTEGGFRNEYAGIGSIYDAEATV